MFKITICDNNTAFLETVSDHVKKVCQAEDIPFILKTFDASDELMEEIGMGRISDLYILDVSMPVYNGLEIAAKLSEKSSIHKIILLTAYEKYAVDACGMDIFRYVPKADMEDRLSQAVTDALRLLDLYRGRSDYVIANQNKSVRFFQEDVIYLYKDRKYVCFCMKNGELYKERGTLHEIHSRLNNDFLAVLDRGYIVNLLHIKRIDLEEVFMDEGTRLTTNRRHTRELRNRFHAFWGARI